MGALLKKDRKTILGGTITPPGGTPYFNPLPTTAANLAGIPSGSTFPAPMTMQQMWDLLLYPYISPTFSSFAFTGVSVLEVGDSIDSAVQAITWTTTTPANITANSIDIDDITGAVNLETGLANTGSVVHDFSGAGAITMLIEGNNQFRISATDSHAVVFTRDYYVYWEFMGYVGTNAGAGPINQAAVKALSDYAALNTGWAGVYNTSAGNYKYFAFPTTWGSPTHFKDTSTNLDIAMEASYVVAVTNAQGVIQNYNVWRTTNILGAAVQVQVS